MLEKYDLLFDEYKEFIKNNSKYEVRVVKYNTNTSAYFPLVALALSNITSTRDCTLDKIEHYDNYYFTTDIYTKDKIINGKKISSNVISNELVNLTIKFFEKKNMYRTSCRPTPNLDNSILRVTIQEQCGVGNLSRLKNIIRR